MTWLGALGVGNLTDEEIEELTERIVDIQDERNAAIEARARNSSESDA